MPKSFPKSKIITEIEDAADDISTKYTMKKNDLFYGTLEEFGLDWIKLDVPTDVSFQVRLSSPDGTLGVPNMRLVDKDGTLIKGGDQDGNNPRDYINVSLSDLTNSALFIEVRPYANFTEETRYGDYKIDLTYFYHELDKDAPADQTTPYTLQPGDSFQGNISEAGERDWVGVDLIKGRSYVFETSESSFTIKRPYLNIYDKDGLYVSSTRNYVEGDGVEEYLFDVENSGRYYVEVRYGISTKTGQYNLYFNDLEKDGTYSVDKIAQYLTKGYWIDRDSDEGVPGALPFDGKDRITANIKQLDADDKLLAKAAIEAWETTAGLSFKLVKKGGAIRFTHDEDPDRAYADHMYKDSGKFDHVLINVGDDFLGDTKKIGQHGLTTYMHEIGHALGLGHGGDYNSRANWKDDAHYLNDSNQMSIMSYFNLEENKSLLGKKFYELTPMQADLAAIEILYGDLGDKNAGNTTWGRKSDIGGPLGDVFAVLFDGVTNENVDITQIGFTLRDDGGKRDTLDFRGSDLSHFIKMTPGEASNFAGGQGNMVIAEGSWIENYIGGGGADTVYGNKLKNKIDGRDGGDYLTGNGGNDVLRGGDGFDFLDGGKGRDKLIGGGDADSFVLVRGYGKDVVTDFAVGEDYLWLGTNLWKGEKSVAEVLEDHAVIRKGTVVFDFGKHELKLNGVNDLSGFDESNVFLYYV